MRAQIAFAALAAVISTPAVAQSRGQLQADIATLRAELDEARTQLAQQERRLRALEARGLEPIGNGDIVGSAQGGGSTAPGGTATAQQSIERVGTAPVDFDRAPEVAVLGDQGSIVTRAGQLVAEFQGEYARADRNRAVFRGEGIANVVLIGAFDINESRQDVLTAAGALRYGVTDRLEAGIRLAYVRRADGSILAPIADTANTDGAATSDTSDKSATGSGIGDLELSARYQVASARAGWPFLIANLQGVIPTGTNPFAVPRDGLGRALKAATGAGFYGVSPSLTAILPTDPAVLFGTIGYAKNFARDVTTRIGSVQIDRVDPGDALSFSAGIGLALNQRSSLNLGYAHSWGLGTKTWTRAVSESGALGPIVTTKSRDLQVGRLLFGVTYRASDRASINWSVEVGATDDATDLRTVLRIPIVLLTGGG